MNMQSFEFESESDNNQKKSLHSGDTSGKIKDSVINDNRAFVKTCWSFICICCNRDIDQSYFVDPVDFIYKACLYDIIITGISISWFSTYPFGQLLHNWIFCGIVAALAITVIILIKANKLYSKAFSILSIIWLMATAFYWTTALFVWTFGYIPFFIMYASNEVGYLGNGDWTFRFWCYQVQSVCMYILIWVRFLFIAPCKYCRILILKSSIGNITVEI